MNSRKESSPEAIILKWPRWPRAIAMSGVTILYLLVGAIIADIVRQTSPRQARQMTITIAVVILIGVVLIWVTLGFCLNRTEINIDRLRGAVRIRRRPIPWIGRRSISLDAIEQLDVVKMKPPTHWVVRARNPYGRWRLVVVGVHDVESAKAVEHCLEQALQIKDEPGSAQVGHASELGTRWREKVPLHPSGAIGVVHNVAGRSITVEIRRPIWAKLVAAIIPGITVFVFVWAACARTLADERSLSEPWRTEAILPAVALAFIAAIAGLLWVHRAGQRLSVILNATIEIDESGISRLFNLGSRSIPLNDIERFDCRSGIRIPARKSMALPIGPDLAFEIHVQLRNGRRDILLTRIHDREAALFVTQLLEKETGIRAAPIGFNHSESGDEDGEV